MRAPLKAPRRRSAALRLLRLTAIAATLGTAVPAIGAGIAGVAFAAGETHPVVLANSILDRWEPIAIGAGARTPAWRELFATQLTAMDVSVLRAIDRVTTDGAGDPKMAYARFEHAMRGAVMQSYMLAQSGKGHMKLGSPVVDQVFVPITPCRIVDTQHVGGPIAAGTTRNFLFYSTGAADDWSGQGGVAGPSGTTCPGTILPNGGVYSPTAAVVTITVVSPSAAGNWIIWGGGFPKPEISALNWQAGDIKANTTVIPGGGRSGSGPGGGVQDFAVAYNGPTGSAQFVADVVGYMVENQATALDCFETAIASMPIFPTQTATLTSAACIPGWTLTKGNCDTSVHDSQLALKAEFATGAFPQAQWNCTYTQGGSAQQTIYASSICCRVPGR